MPSIAFIVACIIIGFLVGMVTGMFIITLRQCKDKIDNKFLL